MARLETQINQIYLTLPEAKKNSLILHEEQLTNSLQIYVVAELWNIQKKSETADLKKIFEIILASFNANKKLSAEVLFETSLSQINQNLADLAHSGRKSWVGKFSCLICIKGLDNNIYVANNGQTSAWLKRKSQLMEILSAEKRGTHPLKTFINFTQGKLADGDNLILTTSNIFNYISFELFTKILDQHPLDKASEEISKILKDSVSDGTGFSSFLVFFSKEPAIETAPAVPPAGIYAPLPEEEIISKPRQPFNLTVKIKSLFSGFSFIIPQVKIPYPAAIGNVFSKTKFPEYFKNLSFAGKFFFVSFAIFLLLFLINVGIIASKIQDNNKEKRAEQLVEQINNDIARTESALIYQNENEALNHLAQTITDLEELERLDPAKADQIRPEIEQIKTRINKINVVLDPGVYAEVRQLPTMTTSTSVGILFGNEDSNSLSLFRNNTISEYFLLNSLDDALVSVDYFAPAGVVAATENGIFRIDENLKQFEALIGTPTTDIKRIKTANNFLYTLAAGQITRTSFGSGRYQTQNSITGDFTDVRDFGLDRDFYLLYPNRIIKYVSGQPQAFPLPNMSDEMTNAVKIYVGSNLYILESNKKRLLVLSKNGALINQIYFPSMTNPVDFFADEASRNIYVLDGNKLFQITF